MSAAARLYWPHQQQTCWHRTALDGNNTVLVDEDLSTLKFLKCKYHLFSFLISCVQCVTASVVYRSEFLATDPEAVVRFPALPVFLRSIGSARSPLNLLSTTEGLLGRNCSGAGLGN
jgi:hypothetical protein